MTTKFKRKNRLLSMLLVVIMVIGMVPVSSSTVHAEDGGACAEEGCTGTYFNGVCSANSMHYEAAIKTTEKYDIDGDKQYDTVYEIANSGQLRWFASQVNAGNTGLNAVVTAEIEITSSEWTVIGSSKKPYTGIFDGQGYKINFSPITSGMTNYFGLFGWSSGTILKVNVSGSSFGNSSIDYVGGIVGYNDSKGVVKECSSNVKIYGASYVGGIAGYNKGNIENCENYGAVAVNKEKAGGIVGENFGTIQNCTNNGKIKYSVTGITHIGGIVGKTNGTTQNCVNNGDVTGVGIFTGGIAGYNEKILTMCTNNGKVTGNGKHNGGIVGYNEGNTTRCFNTQEVKPEVSLHGRLPWQKTAF